MEQFRGAKKSSAPTERTAAGLRRRGFLKAVSTGLAGAALAQLAPARFAHAQGSGRIRIGLVGCGGRGSGATANALSSGSDVQLYAMADLFNDRMDGALGALRGKHADKIDVPQNRRFLGFDAYEKLLQTEIDAVILATPGGFRPFHFEAAVRYKKPCFLEKPVAVDAYGLSSLAGTNLICKQSRIPIGVGLQDRSRHSIQAILAEIGGGALGKIKRMDTAWNFPGTWAVGRTRANQEMRVSRSLSEMEFQIRSWLGFSWLSGDFVMEALIHNLDLCFLANASQAVRAIGSCEQRERKSTDFGNVSDFLRMEVEFANQTKMIGEMTTFQSRKNESFCNVVGEKGTASLINTREIRDNDGKVVWTFPGKDNDPYQEEINAWLAAVRNGTNLNTLDSAIETHTMAIMGRTAAYRGAPVEMSEMTKSREKLCLRNPLSFTDLPPVLPDRFGDYEFPARPVAS